MDLGYAYDAAIRGFIAIGACEINGLVAELEPFILFNRKCAVADLVTGRGVSV